MKKSVWGMLIFMAALVPSVSYAKVPLFFQTGDELFEIEGALQFDDGYSVGYACKRFALLGADLWTWDCELMAVNLDAFAVGDLEPDYKAELEAQYSLGDRVRNPWNQFGGFALGLLVVGGAAFKLRK